MTHTYDPESNGHNPVAKDTLPKQGIDLEARSDKSQALIQGLEVLPDDLPLCLLNKGKRPIGYGWQNRIYSKARAAEVIANGETLKNDKGEDYYLKPEKVKGYGVILGLALVRDYKPYTLMAVDADGARAEAKLQAIAGEACPERSRGEGIPQTVTYTSGKEGRCQRLFLVPMDKASNLKTYKEKFSSPGEEDELLEFRYKGHSSNLPPSYHPDTGSYRYVEGCSFAETDIAIAPEWLIDFWVGKVEKKKTPPPSKAKKKKPKPPLPPLSDDYLPSWNEIQQSSPPFRDCNIPLERCLSRECAEMVKSGEPTVNKGRNDSGIQLALDLIGTQNYLDSIGQPYEGDAYSIFMEWCQRSGLSDDRPGNQDESIWKSAQARNPGPSSKEGGVDQAIRHYFWGQVKRERGQRNIRKSFGEYQSPQRTSSPLEKDPFPTPSPYIKEAEQIGSWEEAPEMKPSGHNWMAKYLAKRLWNEARWNEQFQEWYLYDEEIPGVWTMVPERVFRAKLTFVLNEIAFQQGTEYTTPYFKHVLDKLKDELFVKEWKPDPNLIAFRNGVLDMRTKDFSNHSPKHQMVVGLPHIYTKKADCPKTKDWLRFTQYEDESRVQLLRAYLASVLRGETKFEKFLELVGTGGTGKSTFQRLASAMVGKANTAVTRLDPLEDNSHELEGLIDKRLLLITEASRYAKCSVLKSLTGNDSLRCNPKHKRVTCFTPQLLVILASNEPTQFNDKTNGILRRRLLVPFNRPVLSSERRNLIQEKHGRLEGELVPEIPGLINWCLNMPLEEVEAYLDTPEKMVPSLESARKEQLLQTNSIAAWLDDNVIHTPGEYTLTGQALRQKDPEIMDLYHEVKTKLYPNYRQWCDTNGYRFQGSKGWADQLVELCSNIRNLEGVSKEHNRKGTIIWGLTLREEGDTESPRPITGDTPSAQPTPPEPQPKPELEPEPDPAPAEVDTPTVEGGTPEPETEPQPQPEPVPTATQAPPPKLNLTPEQKKRFSDLKSRLTAGTLWKEGEPGFSHPEMAAKLKKLRQEFGAELYELAVSRLNSEDAQVLAKVRAHCQRK